MTKPRTYSLRVRTKQYFTRAFLLFSCLLLVLLAVMFFSTRSLSRNYLHTSLKQTGGNIDSYLNQIQKSAFSVTSSTAFLNYYSVVDPSRNTDDITSMFETANNLSVQVSSFADLAVVSTSGNISSYLSGYSYSIFPYLRDSEIFSADNVSRGFLFFSDEDDPALSGWFVYYFPIQDFVIGSTTTSQKTATAFFLFYFDTLSEYLRAAEQENSGCELLYEGVPVCGISTPAGNGIFSPICDEVTMGATGFSVSGFTYPSVLDTDSAWVLLLIAVPLLAILLFFLLRVESFVRRSINEPVTALLDQLHDLAPLTAYTPLSHTEVLEFNQIIDTTNEMIHSLRDKSRQILLNQDKLYELELRNREAELYALQSQLNPHFLYNTLECIRALATVGRVEEIKTIVQQLSSFYRYSAQTDPYVTMLDEVDVIYQYLSIYQIRTDGRLTYDIDIEESLLERYTIRMLLQPIVENSIIHGFQSKAAAPRIQISGFLREDGNILLRVIDNGSGISYARLQELRRSLEFTFDESRESSNRHFGLYNINRRIKLLLGDAYGMSIFSNDNGTEVDILLPLLETRPDHPVMDEEPPREISAP